MNIDTIPDGPELDMLIAEKVMGWRGEGLKAAEVGILWCPSTHIAHAWEVMSKLTRHQNGDREATTLVAFALEELNGTPPWLCRFEPVGDVFACAEARGETAPLAICRAALKAVGA